MHISANQTMTWENMGKAASQYPVPDTGQQQMPKEDSKNKAHPFPFWFVLKPIQSKENFQFSM